MVGLPCITRHENLTGPGVRSSAFPARESTLAADALRERNYTMTDPTSQPRSAGIGRQKGGEQ